jgi:membrane protein involved in colicin uptake
MSAGSKRFGRAITNRKRQQDNGAKAIARANKLRERQKAERMALVAQTADGLAPAKRAALLAAQRKADTDPRAKAKVERAEVEKRVRDTRKLQGIGEVVRPITLIGEQVTEVADIPMSVAQRRAQKQDKK